MLRIFKSPNKSFLSEMKSHFEELHLKMDHRFNEVSAKIHEIEQQMKEMERKLLKKDLVDKQNYGHLHYKLHEMKNPKLEESIEDLKSKLSRLKKNDLDQ